MENEGETAILFDMIKDVIGRFFRSRLLILGILFVILSAVLIHRLFVLQIINGEEYESTYQVQTKKEVALPCTRGSIYDCNGELLAYNEIVYSVVIEDSGNYDTVKEKNDTLNTALLELFSLIETHNDQVVTDFSIVLNQAGAYEFAVSDREKEQFLAAVYKKDYDKLEDAQKNATADEVMAYLCDEEHYQLEESDTLSKSDILKLVTIRFDMTQNNYQKYVVTTVAEDVSAETVSVVMEKSSDLPGVSIQEDTIRRYHEDSFFAAHIIGYTGVISETELTELKAVDEKYTENYVIGKSGIEQAMENVLQGKQGSESFYVDNLGKVLKTEKTVAPEAGNDVYLTIDIGLQKAIYQMLERHIAGVLVSNIVETSAYDTHKIDKSDDVVVSIDDVYFALIDNNVLQISSFSEPDASAAEQQIYQIYSGRKQEITAQILEQLQSATPATLQQFPEEMQAYMNHIVEKLKTDGVLNTEDAKGMEDTIQEWKDGTTSLRMYLFDCIGAGQIDISKFDLQDNYADGNEIYQYTIDYITKLFDNDLAFSKMIYEYLLMNRVLPGKLLCMALYDQGVLADDGERAKLENGTLNPFNFMINKITSLQITPAQLALDPCSGSCVVTDVNTGQVKAMVTYPSYDNAKLANRIDGNYYSKLLSDKSLPLYNRATQQKTAPGSTFKMMSSVAGLEEGVITPDEKIEDEGRFVKVSNMPKCWYYPRSHGSINVSQAIEHSCNYFFYEVGYRLSTDEDGDYNEPVGIEKLTHYAKQLGLGEKSGVEIEESAPNISQKYPVMAAIGQAEHNFTSVQLAKYVTAVANSGTVYNLTLIDKTMTAGGELIEDFAPSVYNQTDFAETTWNAVHEGMRAMASNTDTLRRVTVQVAGKTGTAQENPKRPNHALFVGYAPYDNPEISVVVREAYGYSSANATSIAKDVFNYYFTEEDKRDDGAGNAIAPGTEVIHD